MSSQEYLQPFADLFAGRFDVYATAFPNPHKPGKMSYALKKEPLTPQVLQDHLDGKHRVGVYPLVDGYVRWFAVDFDAPKDAVLDGLSDEEIFALAWQEAEAQAQRFEQEGLFVYLERSRSGLGVHLWGFFDEPVDALTTLQALKPLLLDAESFDRMYPVQSEVKKGGYGNLIALPFHGKSLETGCTAFLNRDTLEPIGPAEFMQTVSFNFRAVIEELAEKAPKDPYTRSRSLTTLDGDSVPRVEYDNFNGRPERPIRGFLKMISQFGCKFMQHCVKDAATLPQTHWWVAIGQTTCFEHGRDAAHLISMLDRKRYNEQETDEMYDRLMQQTPHGCAYIHANFPEHACTGCPMKAPYHVAQKPILELVRDTVSPLEKRNWKKAAERVRRRNNGEEQTGIPWHTAGLDKYTRLRRAEFIVVGARPSVGKTAFMVDAAYNLALHGTPVMVFSAETGETSLEDRFLARVSGIDSKILRGEGDRPITEDEMREVEAAVQKLDALPIYINYAATRADQILALVEETVLVNRIPLDQEYVIFQDYLQFGNATDPKGGDTPYTRISKVSSEFKAISMILNNAFLTFTQLKRDAEGDDKPGLDAARESGQIEQDANVFMVLSGERIPGKTALRNLDILKDKEGEAGIRINLLLHQAVCHFEPVGDREPRETKDLFAETPDVGSLI